MENTVVLLIRNLVMLACLFVVPLVALLGPSVTGFRSPRLLAAAESPRTSAKPELGEKERARGSSQPMGVPHLPASMFAQGLQPPVGGSAERSVPPVRPAATSTGAPSAAQRNVVQTVAAEIAPDQGDQVQPAHLSASPVPARGAPFGQGSRVPVAALPSVRPATAPQASSVAWPPTSPASEPRRTEQDYLETLTTRLRELGAGYYLLECWGQQQKVYRFYCQMGESGPQATSFEATAPDQVSAVERVLDQAEAWGAARNRPQMAERPRGTIR